MPTAATHAFATAAAASGCRPLAESAISAQDADAVARTLRAIADPARVRILSIVASNPDRATCVCDLQESLGLAQPTVSHHLKVLMDAGFLTRTKRGTWAYYSLVPGSLDSVAELLRTSGGPGRDA